MTYGLWSNPRYLEAAAIIVGGLIVLSFLMFFLQRKGPPFTTAWASLKSWLFVAPLLFLAFALPKPWPLVFTTWMGVLSAKSFFQLVGMYHRSWFVWITYIFIFALGHMVNEGWVEHYNVMPELFLATILMIPLIRNSASHMIQYIALSLIAFLFWGWAYMHMGRLMMFEGGELMVLYLYLLTEAAENTQWACSRLFGRVRMFNKISSRISLEGMLVAICVTMLLAWGMRHLLPDRSEKFWIASGLVAAIFGRLGDLIINVFRRDLGVKNTGVFIIGRDGILTRVEKLIFVGPMYYYIYIYLQNHY